MLKRVFAVAAIAVVALTACSGGSDPGPEPAGATATDEVTDPIVAEGGGGGLGSCAFEFSPQTLAERGFAFDGTVVEIRDPEALDAPYEVVFDVTLWYSGGQADTVTLKTYDVSGTSLSGDIGLEQGERILASGDDDFLWGCGFSMPYTDQDAEVFEEAFAG